MPLLDFWKASKEELSEKELKQIMPLAGGGKLLDGSDASLEFRDFLDYIPSELLVKYANDCLSERFNDSGLALQDIINQIGIRIGMDVNYGKYRSKHDGLWRLPNGNAIVVEVKTSDTYLTDLTPIVKYRKELISKGEVLLESTYMLWVVGEENTGGFEAQIRGSKYAWDMRVISVSSLCRLMLLKEDVDDPNVVNQIHEILIPREFTKLDNIVDLLFTTAKEVQYGDIEDAEEVEENADVVEKKFTPVAFHSSVIEVIRKRLTENLIKKSKSTYYSKVEDVGVVCIVSKTHKPDTNPNYWFAFHPHQEEFLMSVSKGYIALGCGSPEQILLLPSKEFVAWIKESWMTESKERIYWHVVIYKEGESFIMHRKKGSGSIDVSEYLIKD
ncbi:hypothetical protein KQI52_07580 [bacterium]|nr:hypothetical protein [bacterium]